MTHIVHVWKSNQTTLQTRTYARYIVKHTTQNHVRKMTRYVQCHEITRHGVSHGL
jgi:hypothetical protein